MNKVLNFIKENKFLVIILLVAAILRFYKINFQSLWMDEIYTMNITNPENSFTTIISEVNQKEGFPYLYFILMKIFYFIFGYSPLVTRGFSAIMGIASVYAIYLIGKALYSKNVGLYAALLLTFSEYCIAESQDARPYAFYLFSVIMTFYSLVIFIKKYSLKNAIQYGIFAGLLLNASFFGFINLFSQALIVLFFLCIIPKEEKIIYFKRVCIAGLIALLMFLPNIYKLSTLLGFKSTWIPAPTGESFTFLFRELLGNSEMTLFLFMPLFIFFLVTIFKEKNTVSYNEILERKNVFSFIILIFWFFILIIFLFLKSYLDTPLIISRYFTSIVPVFYLIFGSSIAMISNKIIRYTILICLISFMWINHDIVRKYYDTVTKSQYREVSNFIIDNNKNNETVYTSLSYWYRYYMPAETKINLVEKPLEDIIKEMIQDSTKVKEFWYADAHNRPFNPSDEAKKFLETKFFVENNLDGYDAWTKHFIRIENKKSVDVSKFKDLKSQNGDLFGLNIESFKVENNLISISGWAFFENQPSDDTSIQLLLIKDKEIKMLQTQKIIRNDISEYFKSSFDYKNSGFTSSSNMESLPSGQYKVGVYLINKALKKEGLIVTDKVVNKK